MSQYILTLDQGTTSSRAIIFNQKGQVVEMAQQEFRQIYPKPSWVEHDPKEIWSTQAAVAATAITKAGINGKNIAAIGITNQRETTVVWERDTGKPIYNAIVWQDRRTADFCNKLKAEGHAKMIQEKTGLVIDAYFSASKIKWILDHVDGAREKARHGKLCFGTVDTWLMAKFTNLRLHATDASNASRTMLYNIHSNQWDDDLLKLFDIPKEMMPEVKSSSEVYSQTATTLFATKIPIAGVAGDQQAALFGQMCTEPGMLKTTYGTGCFMMMNTGDTPAVSNNNLLTTIAWQLNGKTTYALEGSVFMGGAVIQWLRDELGILQNAADSEKLALSVADNGGVYLVPAMAGLGAPHWDQSARGSIFGLTRGSSKAHIARAALESIAYQVVDIVNSQISDTNIPLTEMRVDGGAVANNFLMQFQADMLNAKVIRPQVLETTALGAAYLAGLAVGYWSDVNELKSLWSVEKEFISSLNNELRTQYTNYWHKAVTRAKGWSEE
ncbi:glycerol kinase GlpK [Cysteiniphilum sp. QT6929]|uniref:glycerol kinase GlpK n=1 Tax=Cysteiniphilum sp. QT6929 TaxID=2975055 RepID=UPI0024B35046|nr:glycerol kinase GlpK [Cysteiniphilum sp. QT6929]WHN64803.1 glycerol kinase GlpK [Cysteiniphilum sp. QT6929]